MLRNRTYYCWLILMMVICSPVLSQQADNLIPADTISPESNSTYIVGTITISGNKKTKPSIILREIPFKPGESYPLKVLVQKFEDSRRQLMNTALFLSVVVAAGGYEGNKINIIVEVKERWYLFPAPYFKPVDRNLNQWLVQQKASLERINYGAKLYYYNATGHNDKLKAVLINGYTKQVSFSYDRLYIDKKMKWGLRTGFGAGQNREINYNTIADKQAFFKNEKQFVGKFLNAYTELTYRRAIRTRHSFGISYNMQSVEDTIIKLNPDYINDGSKKINYPSLYYSVSYYDLDYIPYPTKGYATEVYLAKRGLNKKFNLWELHVKAAGNWHLFPKTFAAISVYGAIKAPFKQPFVNQRFLGYGDSFLQGYEYYVIDGSLGGYIKASLNREFLNFKVRVPPLKKGKEATHIPFRLVSKIYGNAGYVHNPQPGDNMLSNRMLYSGGIGIDIITFYDIIFKFEWSFNQLGENGIYLHRKSIF
jgi:outer membrane protein assembly factor BamA